MLERIQVNSITHPYSSCILLTPPSAHQSSSGFKRIQPHLAAGWAMAAHRLWEVTGHCGNGQLKGDRPQRNSCGSPCLAISWPTAGCHGRQRCSEGNSREGDGTSGFRAQRRPAWGWGCQLNTPRLRQGHH